MPLVENDCIRIYARRKSDNVCSFIRPHGAQVNFDCARVASLGRGRRLQRSVAKNYSAPVETDAVSIGQPRDAIAWKWIERPHRGPQKREHRDDAEEKERFSFGGHDRGEWH